MARPLRMDYPDTFYHVLSRENERKEIFRDEKDHLRFLDTLGKIVERFKLEVHAYVLMNRLWACNIVIEWLVYGRDHGLKT
jgi:putative transposase